MIQDDKQEGEMSTNVRQGNFNRQPGKILRVG